jgi:hypothetical protein
MKDRLVPYLAGFVVLLMLLAALRAMPYGTIVVLCSTVVTLVAMLLADRVSPRWLAVLLGMLKLWPPRVPSPTLSPTRRVREAAAALDTTTAQLERYARLLHQISLDSSERPQR